MNNEIGFHQDLVQVFSCRNQKDFEDRVILLKGRMVMILMQRYEELPKKVQNVKKPYHLHLQLL